MPTTSKGLRWPAGSDSPNISQYFQNLANDVDGALPKSWVNIVTTDSGYNFSPSAANAWEALQFMSVTTIAVPVGRTLNVDFRAPACNAGDGFVHVRLLINNVEFDTNVFSAAWAPVRLSGSLVSGAATGAAIIVQAQRTGTSGDVRAAAGGVVRLRYQIA